MNPFGFNEAMVCVSESWGPDSDHRPSVQSVSLGLFCPESKAQGHLWLGRAEKGADVYWVCWWFDFSERVDEVVIDVLRWRKWGLVARLTSPGSWEGLSCSLLPPDSPSDSFTGGAVAHAPEICSARGSGSQSTCLEPCLWSPGRQTWILASLEGLWTLWDEIGAEFLGSCF